MIWYYWVAAAVIFFVIEAIVPGLVSIWFAIGAVTAAIVSAAGGGFVFQLIVFVAVSIAALLLTKLVFKKTVKLEDSIPTNSDAAVGKEALTVTEISPDDWAGKVVLGAEIWSAQSSCNIIPKGTRVRVLEVKGAHFTVEPTTTEKEN